MEMKNDFLADLTSYKTRSDSLIFCQKIIVLADTESTALHNSVFSESTESPGYV